MLYVENIVAGSAFFGQSEKIIFIMKTDTYDTSLLGVDYSTISWLLPYYFLDSLICQKFHM